MLAPHRKGKANKPQPRASTEAPAGEDNAASPMTVLPSSTDLFYFYGQSLEQCAKLSTGQALFDLCTLHKKWLRIYAGGEVHFAIYLLLTLILFLEEVLAINVKR